MSGEGELPSWFYVDGQQKKCGPFQSPEFKALAEQGVIKADTLIWSEGYDEWLRAAELEGLIPGKVVPPPMPPVADGLDRPAAPPTRSVDPMATERPVPRQGSFMFPRIVAGLIGALVVTVAAGVGLAIAEVPPAFSLLVFVTLAGLSVLSARVAYRKEKYELHEKTVICRRGGLVSDETTELEVRNITHVKMQLPWLRHKLFGIGNVVIESAGNAQPVVLRAIRDPEAVYARMSERMKRNGYDLSQEELLHEEQPAMLGVVTECLGGGVAALFAIMLGVPTLTGFAKGAESVGLAWLPWVLGPVFVMAAIGFLIAHFLDLRRRTYRVYNDVVVYEEGFLTRQNAFIPYENIADASTKRTFLDQLLSLFDVVISCQGSSSEIKFRRLRHGPQLSACIDRLVIAAGAKPAPRARTAPNGDDPAQRVLRRAEPELVTPSDAWIADLKMHPARVIIPLLILLPLLPIWLIATIRGAVMIFSTRYAVRSGSIRHSYRFLTTHDREFAYDKITGLVIKQNLWDQLFGTFTLRFWSIGSGQSLELAHVARSEVNLEAVLRQIGIPAPSAPPHEVQGACLPLTWLRARCLRVFGSLTAVVVLIAILPTLLGQGTGEFATLIGVLLGAFALIVIGRGLYAMVYFSRQRLCFHEHHVEAEQGILIRQHYYARYRNVKKTLVTRYPGGSAGALQVFVAGEQQVGGQEQGKKGQKGVTLPCSFTLGFLPEAERQAALLDDILCGRIDPCPDASPAEALDVILESGRAVGNSVVRLLIGSTLLVLPLVLLPVTLPLLIVAVKRWRYRIDEGRVLVDWGVLFAKRATVLLDRVDSLQQQQGPLNKMFKNGNVVIMTAGSSKPDLILPASPDYLDLYQEIRGRSQGG